jgi:hypothetical protein
MSARCRTLAHRLVNGVVGVVDDRAPWLADQAYRAVARPLQWVDPAGGARAAEARLDDIRDRVVAMAATGRVGRAEQRRLRRDLGRTHEDLTRIAARLPTVQARALTRRLATYTQILGSLPGRPVARNRAARVGDAAVLTGAAGTWTGVLLPVAGTTAAVEGGLAAGVVTAVGVTAIRSRRARKARIAALAAALTQVDRAALGPDGADLRDLDAARRTLFARTRASRRLDGRGLEQLRRIDALLDDLLIRLVEGDLEADASHLVRAGVTRYLPDTLEPLLALADPRAVVGGRPVAVEVADQLASIERGLAEVAGRPARNRPENLLFLQGEFLRSKFGEPPA